MKRGATFSGPFFERDPRKTFRQNARDLMDAIASEGQNLARAAATGPEGDAVRDRIIGRTHALRGRRWALTAVVSVSTAGLSQGEARRLMAIAAGRHRAITAGGRNIGTTEGLEGRTHTFRRTSSRLRRMRADAAARLLRGIA